MSVWNAARQARRGSGPSCAGFINSVTAMPKHIALNSRVAACTSRPPRRSASARRCTRGRAARSRRARRRRRRVPGRRSAPARRNAMRNSDGCSTAIGRNTVSAACTRSRAGSFVRGELGRWRREACRTIASRALPRGLPSTRTCCRRARVVVPISSATARTESAATPPRSTSCSGGREQRVSEWRRRAASGGPRLTRYRNGVTLQRNETPCRKDRP